ncbi:MAG: DUF2938 domain-containing protein [Hyphomicrobiales bacterium]|nr:DUF2938 domain-containing protein [Hyphomicrobiales bacterium]
MGIVEIIVVGVIATACLDIWQQIYRLLFGTPITNWAMIGRWAAYIPKGQLVHENIGKTPAVANEEALGWAVHYIVGIGYAVVYLVLMWFIIQAEPGFVSAMIFGAVSVAVTWFAMEPILGAGVMASKTPKPTAAMAHDFTSHLSFGFGLFLGVVVFRALFGGG